jgi:hypothetical protein
MAKDASSQTDRSDAEQDIDENLRRAFDHIANEPLPDRFGDLLAQLRAGKAPPQATDDDDVEGTGPDDGEPTEGGTAR